MATFEEFNQQALELYKLSPSTTRFTYKYRACDGKLEMKITDDKLCFKFETDQLEDLKRMETLQRKLMFHILDAEVPELPTVNLSQKAGNPISVPNNDTKGTVTNSTATSGKKKNKKKGKK